MTLSERATPKYRPRAKCTICGSPQDHADDRRSVPHLRRYFSLIRATFAHWPERHARQFTNSEDLRKFLQMKAGHREMAASIPLSGINKDRAVILVEGAIKAAGSYAFPTVHKDQLIIWKPKSIAFGKLNHMEAVGLFADVEDVIRAETGLDPAQLMKEHEGAA
jgi:hypothetical protein